MTEQEISVGILKLYSDAYDRITKEIVAIKNEWHSLSDEIKAYLPEDQRLADGLDAYKDRILTPTIAKRLKDFDLYNQWLKLVPGIGPSIAARLIKLLKYSYIPICKVCKTPIDKQEGQYYCQNCDKSIKGDGNLSFMLKPKEFLTISKWWAYMGMHTVDGVMPKRKKGVMVNWNTEGRTLCFLIGDSFIKQGIKCEYRKIYDEAKSKYQQREDLSKGHIHAMAKRKAVKLFLSHLWMVDRMIEGKSIESPWIIGKEGHQHLIAPYYWDSQATIENHVNHASQLLIETHKNVASQREIEIRVNDAIRVFGETQPVSASHITSETQSLPAKRTYTTRKVA